MSAFGCGIPLFFFVPALCEEVLVEVLEIGVGEVEVVGHFGVAIFGRLADIGFDPSFGAVTGDALGGVQVGPDFTSLLVDGVTADTLAFKKFVAAPGRRTLGDAAWADLGIAVLKFNKVD